jgi:iron complex outermembrane receptor protein
VYRLLSIIFLFFITLSAIGQNTATLYGKIINTDDEAIARTTVHILNTNFGTAALFDGSFAIADIPYGKYQVQISAIGYASIEQSIAIDQPNKELNITLTESSIQLEAVVVTAQKTEEEIQKVPISISAITAKQVLEYRLWNSKDITAIVPNLYAANPGDNRNVTSIRGITSTSYDPSVTTYIDGVNQFSLDTYIAQLSDIERIEVLRGPQGTLYGRNAMGGVINIITRQPSNQTSGFGEANIGSHGQQRYSLGVRTPVVTDKLFFGISGMYNRHNGFYTNVFYDSHFDKQQGFMGNYFVKYMPSSKWVFTLNAKHNQVRNNGAFPLVSSVEAAFENPFEVNQNAVANMVDNNFNASLSAHYAGYKFNFTSQTAFQSNYRLYESPLDGDFSPIDGVTIINDYGKDWNKVKVVTQEFKFTSPAQSSSPLRWTTGAYLFYQFNPVRQGTHFGEDAAFIDPDATPNTTILTSTTGENKGVALYGQLTYQLNKRLSITGGLRYDYEHKEQDALSEFYFDGNPDPAFEIQPDTSAAASFNALSPKLVIAYAMNEQSNFYLSYAKGFRAGGLTSISPDPSQPPLYAYKPEYSNNLEAGVKNMFLKNRLKINVSLFHIIATDVQIPTLLLPEAFIVTFNAGELKSTGVELELSAAISNKFKLDYSFGYTRATFTDLVVPNDGKEIDLSGNHQLFSPEATSMLAAQYSFDLGSTSAIKFVARAEWQYLGRQYFDLANTIEQSPYSLLNTRFGVVGKSFEIMFWGRNLTDQKYISYAYNFGATRLGDPMNWGVTLRKNF